MRKIYLAIPYSGMEKSSYEQANRATVILLSSGYNVLSPISHSHPLTYSHENIELPGTWEFWSKVDYQFIDWSDEIIVLIPKEGYDKVRDSTGVQAEIKYGIENNKSVTFYTMEMLTELYNEYKWHTK